MKYTFTPELIIFTLSVIGNILGTAYTVRAGILKRVAEENERLAKTRGETNADLSKKLEHLEERIAHLEQVIKDKDRKIDDLLDMLGKRKCDHPNHHGTGS